jgi:phosphoadenosine phosphosulfate reductase
MPDLFGHTSEEEMYQTALSVPLPRKIEIAVETIRMYERKALELSPDGYYVAFSGGKDSIVMEKLFALSGVKYQLWYNNVTIDPPELVRFIKRQYPQCKWNNIGTPLPMMMAKKSNGPPTRLARWCCEIYKEQGGNGYLKSIGVRADESARRKGLWKTIVQDRNHKNGLILCPILYWSEADIWHFIRTNDMPYCSLYDEGFKRLGCIGCPMGGPKNQRREFGRYPRYEALWKRGFQAYWNAWKGVPRKDGEDRWIEKFNTVDQLWEWGELMANLLQEWWDQSSYASKSGGKHLPSEMVDRIYDMMRAGKKNAEIHTETGVARSTLFRYRRKIKGEK